MVSTRRSPNFIDGISARSTISGTNEYLTSTNGSLNVTGALSISGSTIPISGTTTAVAVGIVDGSGNQITSFGGGTQYAEGTTTSPGTGTLSLGRYLTADPTLTANQVYGIRLDSNQRLMVNTAALTSANDSVSAAQSGSWTVASTQSGLYKVNPGTTATSTLTSVSGSTSTTQLLSSNTSRSGAYFFNDSTAICYLAFASTASTSTYTVQIQAGGFLAMPVIPVYTGIISAIWSAASGAIKITELS